MDEVAQQLASGKRETKMTERAAEEKLHRLIQSRKAKLGHLTSQGNQIERLMEDDANVNMVKQKLRLDYQDSFGELCRINYSLEQFMDAEEFQKDQSSWYKPNTSRMNGFIQYVEVWIKEVDEQAEQAKHCDADVHPFDSVSVASISSKSRKRGSAIGSNVSNASSVRLKAEMERAALIAQATALKQKQDFERQEAELKAKREEFELQMAIAASDAKLKIIENFENDRLSQASHAKAMTIDSEYIPLSVNQNPAANKDNGSSECAPILSQPIGTQQSTANFVSDEHAVETLRSVMTRQNTITELMVKQQKIMTLPPLDIPTFSGNPIEYNTFIRAFEHGVESRT